jgi:hypothetical protein
MIKHAATATSGACTRACTGAHAARRARPGPSGDCTGAPSPTRPLRGKTAPRSAVAAADRPAAHRASSELPRTPTLSAHARHERERGGEATGAAVPERAHQPAVALPARASSPGAKIERAGAHARRSHAGRRRGRRTAPHAEWEDTPLPITSWPPRGQGTSATRPRQSCAKRIVVMPATRPRQCPVPPGFFFAAFLAGLAAHRASGKRIPGSFF